MRNETNIVPLKQCPNCGSLECDCKPSEVAMSLAEQTGWEIQRIAETGWAFRLIHHDIAVGDFQTERKAINAAVKCGAKRESITFIVRQ